MKILYHHRIASKDGQYVHMQGLVCALRELGHEVVVTGPSLAVEQGFGGESRWVRWLKRWIPGAVYELIECAYSVLDYFRLTRAIGKHQPDVVYERYNLFFLSGLWATRRHDLPWIVEVNAPVFDERCTYSGIRLKKLARRSEQAVWRGASHVFAVTHVLARRIERDGVARERISVTPNGIGEAAFECLVSRTQAKQQLGLDGRVVLGFTGFVRQWHGLERVFDAMHALHVRSHFVLVGDGPAKAGLKMRALNAGLAADITFTGVVDRPDIIRYINAFDIALQPAVVAYASPLKLFEYMAAGCAIVAPDQANIREILTHRVDALLFDPDDQDSFCACVAELAADSPLRERLGRAAKATIRQRPLTWKGNAQRVVACARALMSDSTPDRPCTSMQASDHHE